MRDGCVHEARFPGRGAGTLLAGAQASGRTRGGLPFDRFGTGSRVAVVFQGLTFEHAPMRGLEARSTRSMYGFLAREYTLLVLGRRPGLPAGTSIENMADDCAEAIVGEIGAPVDVIGLSTGGSVALEFAGGHPDLLGKLVVHSCAHTLGPTGKAAQRRVREQARAGDWRACSATLLDLVVPPRWYRGLAVRFGSRLMALGAPSDPSDMIATIDAEDRFDCRDRLDRIRAPTLVVAGSDDPFYTPALFRATAEGIPDARLVLYAGMGHPAQGRAFQQAVLAFLRT